MLDSRGGENLERSLTVLKPGGLAIGVTGPPEPGFAKQLGAPKLVGVAMGLLSRRIRKRARTLGVSCSFLFMQADGPVARAGQSLRRRSAAPGHRQDVPLRPALEALSYAEQGRGNGKVVAAVAQRNPDPRRPGVSQGLRRRAWGAPSFDTPGPITNRPAKASDMPAGEHHHRPGYVARMRLHSIAVAAVAAALILIAIPTGACARVHERPDLERHFAAAGTSGTMVVRRSGPRPVTIVVGARRSRRSFLPSSTFKITNSLLAIDQGVASGADQPYPGPNPNFYLDGEPLLPTACEADLTLATAFANSCIPIYQRIARRIGRPAYRRAVRAMRYGNRDVDGAPLDSFWLEGPFAISARDQVRFLERMRRGALPVSRRALREVRAMMVLERTSEYVLRGKTGYVFTTDPRVGWWVGSVARGHRTWTFALNLDITRPEHFGARTSVARAILTELGAL